MGHLVFPWVLEHPSNISDYQWLVTLLAGFLLLAWLIWRFVFPVVGNMLESRARTIEESREQIRQTLEDARRLRDDYQDKLDNIAEETRRRLDEAVAEAAELRAHIEREAREQAAAITERAHREVERDREKALADLRIEFVEEVIDAARYAAAHTLTDDRQERMLDMFVSGIGEAQ